MVVNAIFDDPPSTVREEYLAPFWDLLAYLLNASLTKYQFGGIAKYKVLHIKIKLDLFFLVVRRSSKAYPFAIEAGNGRC